MNRSTRSRIGRLESATRDRQARLLVARTAEPDTRQLPAALLIVSNGFLTLVALAALMSIWFGRTGGL